MKNAIILINLSLIFILGACGNGSSEQTHEYHTVNGRFLSLDEQNQTVSIVHETVPDVMNAMRMNFRLEHISEAEGFQAGDVIRFEMYLDEQGWFVRNFEVLPTDTELDLPENLQQLGKDHQH